MLSLIMGLSINVTVISWIGVALIVVPILVTFCKHEQWDDLETGALRPYCIAGTSVLIGIIILMITT